MGRWQRDVLSIGVDAQGDVRGGFCGVVVCRRYARGGSPVGEWRATAGDIRGI